MPRRPNVLIICTDQHRYDAISTHPGSPARTPHLQALADQGTVFEHCYSPSPVCAPARASMLTGCHPTSHGLYANGVALPDGADLVSRQLADTGYRCGLVGKLHLGPAFQGMTERRGDDGFDFFHWAHDPFHGSPDNAYHLWLKERFPELWSKAVDDIVTPDKTDFSHADTAFDAMPTQAHYSTWVTDTAGEFLETTDTDTPFFLVANFFDPHHPFVAPPEYLAQYPPGSVPPPVGGPDELAGKPGRLSDASCSSYVGHGPSYTDFTAEDLDRLRRTYFAMVTLVDDCVGRLLGTLAERGHDTNTLVIFTSDHGEMLGDHALLLKGPMMYDCAVRVPLLVRWPSGVRAASRVTGFVGLHDIATTVRELTGLPGSAADQGRSLHAVATGAQPARPYALSQYRDSGYSYDPPVHTTMYRTERHKLIAWHGDATAGRPRDGELYDLSTDPDEVHNLWHEPAHRALRGELAEAMNDALVAAENRAAPRKAPW